jgi:4-oxalocrotonate tautomerase
MAIFTLRVSGNKSYSMTKSISQIVMEMNLKYLRGRADFTAILIDYLPVDVWVIGGTTLSEQEKNCLIMHVSVSNMVTSDEKKIFISETFKALNQVIGDLHEDSYINIQQSDLDSFSYNRPFN